MAFAARRSRLWRRFADLDRAVAAALFNEARHIVSIRA